MRFYAPDKGEFRAQGHRGGSLRPDSQPNWFMARSLPLNCDVYGGEAVMQGNRVVGVCTSGAFGHQTGKSLTFAYVEPG